MQRSATGHLAVALATLLAAADAAAQDGAALAASFRDPPRTARAMVLWPWLNGYVDRDQAARELQQMRAKGLRGPIIWDIGSLADPDGTIPPGPAFLGDESLATIRFVLAEAERLGLDVGLVASSSWNAGGAWITPQHASKELRCAEQRVRGPLRFEGAPPRPDELSEPFTEVALLAAPVAAPAGPRAEVLDLSGRVGADGTLRFDVPAGEWSILRFVCCGTGQPLVCPSPASNGLVVDHMSRAATDRHFGVMLDRLLPDGARPPALKMMMLDSFEVWPRRDWTPGLLADFEQTFGYDPRPWLPALVDNQLGAPQLAARFLHDYRELVSRRMVADHFGRAAALLEQHGLELVAEAGHGGYPRVDALAALGAAHVPMGEFWNGKQFWVTKEAASAAHVYGRRDVAAEALTGWRHWRDGPAEYKRLFDVAFCAGLNRPVFHTFAHNPPAAGRPGFAYHAGEHFNVNATWWPQAGPMLQYLARCCHLLRQGDFVADVCFYYGDDAPGIVPSRRLDPKVAPPHDPLECQHCGRPLPNRVDRLGPGYDFDYLDRDMLVRDLRVADGRLRLSSGMAYRVLVLPERDDIALDVLQKLEQLVADGATVVGPRPTRSSSLAGYPDCDVAVQQLAARLWGDDDTRPHGYGRGRVLPAAALPRALQELGVGPDFEVLSPAEHALDYIHRRTADADIYFVANSADSPVLAECAFRVPAGMRPELWDPVDGSITPCVAFRRQGAAVHVPLRLGPIGSLFVVFRAAGDEDHVVALRRADRDAGALVDAGVEVVALAADRLRARVHTAGEYAVATARGRRAAVAVTDLPAALVVPGPWQLRFPAESGATAPLSLDALRSWTELEPDPARYFAGTATYRAELQVPAEHLRPGLALELDLGEVREVAAVTVNGTELGVLWRPPYRVEVTGLLRAGGNRLEVEVTNVWHNRIVGDLRAPDAAPRAVTNLKSRFRADMELLPSGLLGPVVLRAVAEVEAALK